MSVLKCFGPTVHLRFRHVRQSDIELLDLLNHDPGVMTYLDHEPPSREEVAAKIRLTVTNNDVSPSTGTFMAFLRNTHEDTFVGWFALTMANGGQSNLELGYRIRRQFWGRGFATEGSKALIDLGFQCNASIERIFAETMFVNKASRAVMTKCGMSYEKTFHPVFDNPLPGTELGEVVYSISRETWESNGRSSSTAGQASLQQI